MRRGGKENEIHPGDIVVGDIVKITAGMDVPVDGILLKGSLGVEANESAMTGESDDLKKEDFEACLAKRAEKFAKVKEKSKLTHHDIYSPILLSGTQI